MTTGGPASLRAPPSTPEASPTATPTRGWSMVRLPRCFILGEAGGSSASIGRPRRDSSRGETDGEVSGDGWICSMATGRRACASPSATAAYALRSAAAPSSSCITRSPTKSSMHMPSAMRSHRGSARVRRTPPSGTPMTQPTTSESRTGRTLGLLSAPLSCKASPAQMQSEKTATIGTASMTGSCSGTIDMATMPAPKPAMPCTKLATRKATDTKQKSAVE
mmetsp:Transcript_33766/g.79674  ORF Transcript_33766/g.79674 Transcript_33766/m.79674 type:complete len:221 (+) Transcript_33766:219-881(+)